MMREDRRILRVLPAGVTLAFVLLRPATAAAGDGGLAAGAAADARLRQKVTVHVTARRVGDLLERLSKATGVTLVPGTEIAEELVTLWARDRPLLDVMRDLRHLHGWYWSRARRSGAWSYSLWQDAQSRAREEAEIKRLESARMREFAENVRKHVAALRASDEELKRIAQDDPYFVAQMKHPVVRAGYALFGALSPDQQAQLLEERTPSRILSTGKVFDLFPRQGREEDPYFDGVEREARLRPIGDIVSLPWEEMTPAQRTAVGAILKGAREMAQRLALQEPDDAGRRWNAQSIAGADPRSATVSLYRWGDASFHGLNLRVDVKSGERDWVLHSDIGIPRGTHEWYDEIIRSGEFQMWPGAQEEMDRYLGRKASKPEGVPDEEERRSKPREKPHPLLDAPVSVRWALARRPSWQNKKTMHQITGPEAVRALAHTLGRPLIADAPIRGIEHPAPEFRIHRRPLREILARIFPECDYEVRGEAIFIRDPKRLEGRLMATPATIQRCLEERQGPWTLEEIAFLARSLSPREIYRLGFSRVVPGRMQEQIVAARELLQIYGELAPAQRALLAQGIAFETLTPVQQSLFLRFAERHRPFIEGWRAQQGGLRLTETPPPVRDEDGLGRDLKPVKRLVFQVRFTEEESQPFAIDLFPPVQRTGGGLPVSRWVGMKFPFFDEYSVRARAPEFTKPLLRDPRLRGKPLVLAISQPFAEPYAGTAAPTAFGESVRGLARRLAGAGVTVADLTIGPGSLRPPESDPALPNRLRQVDPGDINGQPLDSAGEGQFLATFPTVFVVGRDEVIRAVFEGDAARDVTAIERAARTAASRGQTQAK